jgi:hypothetical protein
VPPFSARRHGRGPRPTVPRQARGAQIAAARDGGRPTSAPGNARPAVHLTQPQPRCWCGLWPVDRPSPRSRPPHGSVLRRRRPPGRSAGRAVREMGNGLGGPAALGLTRKARGRAEWAGERNSGLARRRHSCHKTELSVERDRNIGMAEDTGGAHIPGMSYHNHPVRWDELPAHIERRPADG